MGLLSKGTPLDWHASQAHHAYVKYHGILQFLSVYNAQRNRTNDNFLWGDEVEHLLLTVTPAEAAEKRVQLSLRAAELIAALDAIPAATSTTTSTAPVADEATRVRNANFLPEFGRFMIEATPSAPYGGFTADLRRVEPNMRERRALIEALLQDNERLITLTGFPLMGCPGFAQTSDTPCKQLQGPVADSDYIMDQIIGEHPRFATLSKNIRTRRDGRVDIRVPLFQDVNTARDIVKANAAEQACLDRLAAMRDPSLPPHAPRPADLDLTKEIHMDAMAFGMGMACLQITFQTRGLAEARHLYDHLAVLSPIMLALTAASPFFRGRIADIDVRWTVISQSVDDRTRLERGEEKLPNGQPVEERNMMGAAPAASVATSSAASPTSSSAATAAAELPTRKPQRLYKSRYDSISTYLSLESDFKAEYNDIPCEIDEPSYQLLMSRGVDELLARHIAHLFVRDPLVIYDGNIELDDVATSEHFENLQSTNWQTVRFKPPTPGSPIGWRVEFRTMEVQLTDFENAAFTVFLALVSRALLYFNLNFYTPLSCVDENLKRAHKRDAVNQEKFFWRKHVKVCPDDKDVASSSSSAAAAATNEDMDAYEEMSIRDIMLGSPATAAALAIPGSTGQPGLINLVRTYLDMIDCDELTRRIVDEYLDLIAKRATGELMTAATWLRKFVHQHPKYEHNSLLNNDIVHDIVQSCHGVVKGTLLVPQLLGQYTNLPKVMTADGALESQRPSRELKGANACSASSSAAAASSSTGPNDTVDGPVLDLNQKLCCEKLRQLLTPYLQQAHANNGSRSSSSTGVNHASSASSTSVSQQSNDTIGTPVTPIKVTKATSQDSASPDAPWLSPDDSNAPARAQ